MEQKEIQERFSEPRQRPPSRAGWGWHRRDEAERLNGLDSVDGGDVEVGEADDLMQDSTYLLEKLLGCRSHLGSHALVRDYFRTGPQC